MTSVYVDTSAFLAVFDKSDTNHTRAAMHWCELIGDHAALHCTAGVLIETCALLQRRLGMAALRAFREDVYPLLLVEWLEAPVFDEGMASVLSANRRGVSLVDALSFGAMRRLGLRTCFAYGRHFGEQGFEVIG